MKTQHIATSQRRFLLPILLAIATFTLGACDKKQSETPATQVVAKVNGAEITVHQLNYYLSKAGNIPADKADQVKKGILDRLIEQELFAAKAVEGKLDGKPEILMAIEMAKKEILARGFMEQQLAAGEKLTAGADSRYYYAHPELFAERKIYNLQEVSFNIGTANPEEVQQLVKEKKSLEQIVEHLTKRDVKLKKVAGAVAAEQLPMESLPQFHAAKAGDIVFLTNAKEHNVVLVVSTQSVPIDEEKAKPVIQRFLITKLANEVKEKELKAIKESAKIEYVGNFAALAQAPATPSATAPTPPVPATSAVVPTPPAETSPVRSSEAKMPARSEGGLTKLPPLPHENANSNLTNLPGFNKQ